MEVERAAKRKRKACLNCRRKKTRCPGEVPTCSFCARLNQPCVWDSEERAYSHRNSFLSNPDSALAARVALLESKLSQLDGQSQTFPNVVNSARGSEQAPRPRQAGSDLSPTTLSGQFSSLPPKSVMTVLIDTYFTCCHNQPYAYFHEATFRQRFEQDALPTSLLFAVAATSYRFMDDSFYKDALAEAIASYSSASWAEIFQQTFSYEEGLDAVVVQVMSMLAVVDFTSGHPRQGWVKVALAVRFAQALHLNEEPATGLPAWEREERRRTFWSIYLLDRLISLGPNRPPTFSDSDCTVSLPRSDEAFYGEHEISRLPTLDTVVEDSQGMQYSNLDNFALTTLMACALGQIIRFGLRRTFTERHPPWDWRSTYHKIHGMLLQHESHSVLTYANVGEILHSEAAIGTHMTQQRAGHLVFSQALYHMNHCLLNHPFILYHLFQRTTAFVPLSFAREALDRCRDHAGQLLDHVQEAQNCGRLAESSFYGYCVLLSGVIFKIYEHHRDEQIAEMAKGKVSKALEYLEREPVRWLFHPVMGLVLREFLPTSDIAQALIDPINLAQKTVIDNSDKFWSLIDYASLQSESSRRALMTTVSTAGPLFPMTSNRTASAESVIASSNSPGTAVSNFNIQYLMAQSFMPPNLGNDLDGLWSEAFNNHSSIGANRE